MLLLPAQVDSIQTISITSFLINVRNAKGFTTNRNVLLYVRLIVAFPIRFTLKTRKHYYNEKNISTDWGDKFDKGHYENAFSAIDEAMPHGGSLHCRH
jgi:hypothetical protein